MAEASQLKTRIDSVLQDPSAKAIAQVYAAALLDVVPAEEAAALLGEFESLMRDLLATQPEFASLLTTGASNRNEKLALIDRVFGTRASPVLLNFLKVLGRRDRLDLLPTIFDQLNLLYETRGGRERVEVASAVPLTPSQLESLRSGLKERFGFDAIIKPRVDATLLGGVRIRVGDTVYDSTLRTRLKHLSHQLRERGIHEIQSGRDRFSHP